MLACRLIHRRPIARIHVWIRIVGSWLIKEVSMSAEENRALIRRFLEELFNGHDMAAVDRYIAADYVDHVLPPGVPPNRAGFTQFIGAFFEALPDFHYTIDDVLVDGDKVAVRLTATGTQQGT